MTTRTLLKVVASSAFAATIALGAAAGTASASTTITYSGQGLDPDGAITTEICGVENGAEVDGAYVLFILTANRATEASFDGGDEGGPMTQSGNGAWKFVYTGETSPADLIGVASATYSGAVRGNPQLVISHGCPGDDTPPS